MGQNNGYEVASAFEEFSDLVFVSITCKSSIASAVRVCVRVCVHTHE